ncbi:DUF6624 domain-containing protein [Hymenobacter weizhouensis]|uniref:DUF6624 domain-containing protein n=1 Tax=Hymenobacter sp. YIM 151500-1 TaxID=2987689 RepID=UPI002225E5BA|nr:DUF6624 domain-containing protein [Hymenobacter sp. YIM 151500-1]UYZ62705.1 hypothetical protein OIS53_17105 [Hymenobacter sp. YIM 151500-1]
MPTIRLALILTVLLPALCAACRSTPTQPTLNLRLKRELDSIEVVDQRYRKLMMGGTTMNSRFDSVARAAGIPPEQVGPYLSRRMSAQDSTNVVRIAQIIDQYGYPGRTLVGTPTNEVALLVIQHSTRIPQYLPLVKHMADKGEVDFYLYARMLDRHLMYQGQEQIYGTQGCGYSVPNPTTGQHDWIKFIWPIKDAAHVNERRKKAGFDSTVEANAQRLGIQYKPMTLDEAKRIEQAAKAAPPSHP